MKYQTLKLKMAMTILTGIVLSACSEENSTPTEQPSVPVVVSLACDSYLPEFLTNVWPILEGQCYSCHGVNVANVSSDFNLANSQIAATDFNEINFAEFKAAAGKTDNANLPWALSKPSNSNKDHGGGQVFAVNSSPYTTFQDMVAKLKTCTNTVINTAGVIQHTPYERLRKSTLSLSGRLPTLIEENNLIAAANDSVAIQNNLDVAVDQLMTEAGFYTRLKEIFNDSLLLDAFPTTQLLSKFRLSNFTNNEYFSRANLDAQQYTPQLRNRIRANANRGIADAPLELIVHVVKNNRPLSEILTANYTLVNPYSATIFSDTSNNIAFQFKYGDGLNNTVLPDPSDFREAMIIDKNSNVYPHAGILSTLTYLTRYPSTNTNRNRTRSRVTFMYFLSVDVQGLADRAGLNLDNIIGVEPTLEDPQCTACHTTIDPLAGLFKNWKNNGQFGGDNTKWFNATRMLQPGYSETLLPAARSGTALPWLAEQIVADKRFASTIVNTVFKGLTGQALPKNTAEDTVFEETLTNNFMNSNFEIRVLIKEIINSLYFTAKNLGDAEIPSDFIQLGMGHLLTPEQLNRKILAVTGGYLWRSPSSANRNLNDRNTYRLLYGGIDSISVTKRTTDPTALINGIQQRIAFQVACQAVPVDFSKTTSQRALFPAVEITDLATTAQGQIKIKQNIKHLFKQILGEQYSIGNSEIERAYTLFVNASQIMPSGVIPQDCSTSLGANDVDIKNDKDKTVESWMAVVAYLLSDYQFFYE